MIKIPLIDLDSGMTLYRIHNLPIYHHDIGKTVKYQLEGANLAVTKDNIYATLLTDTGLMTCTLEEGHFCNLNTGLYHINTNQWSVTAMFFKHSDRINKYCKLEINNITAPQANYLDKGHWAISVETITPMETKLKTIPMVKQSNHSSLI